MDKNNLYVAECFVCPGPMLKRIQSQSTGQSIPRDEENLSRDHGSAVKKNKLKEGGKLWDRK